MQTLNMYSSENRVSKFMKQKLLEMRREMVKCTITHGNVNIIFSVKSAMTENLQ